MKFQEDEDGKLNNFALEPKMYKPDAAEGDQLNLLLIGIGGMLVVALIGVTFVISG